MFDGVGRGFGDLLEDGEGLGSGFEGAEGEGQVGELAECVEMGRDRWALGEGEELGRLELLLLSEGDQAVAEEEEGVEEVGFARGEGRQGGRGLAELRIELVSNDSGGGLDRAGDHDVWKILGIIRLVNRILFGYGIRWADFARR